MMSKLVILITATLASLAVGCGDNDDPIGSDDGMDGTGGAGGDGGDGTSNPRVLQATLAALEPYTAITGAALVTSYPGEQAFNARIDVRGDIPGSIRPWHVHVGTCGSGGSIVGPDAAYPRLAINSDGLAVAETNVLVALDAGAYHVNVHYSDAEFSRLIACGDLIRQ